MEGRTAGAGLVKFHLLKGPDAEDRYLERLNPEKLSLALDYIRRAPPEVKTPVRAAVNDRWPPVLVA
jgi:hypothetical protein